MAKINKLTDQGIRALSKPGLYGDGLGLYLQVSTFGTKSWLFRFMRDGKARKMGLGAVHTISLKAARQKAQECRIKLDAGLDPIEDRKAVRLARKAETAVAMTFKQCAKKYIDAHQGTWKNPKHAAQWPSTLKTYVYPVFGDLSVKDIDVGLVLKAIEDIWKTKPETASRVRGRIETVLDWATARDYRSGENPARWRGHLDKLLPARNKVAKVKHHEALPYLDMSAFITDLRANGSISARALEFTILTAVRTNEAIGAKWSEFDTEANMWTIPAERMKGGREHRVPLSEAAVTLLKTLPRIMGNPHVFPGVKEERPLSNMAMLEMVRGLRPDAGLTVHGFRSTFRDWAAEQTAYPNEMVEMALAHIVSDKTEAAYRRGDMLERRRRLMKDWSDYCGAGAPATRTGSVTSIRSAANG
jgi:integrase